MSTKTDTVIAYLDAAFKGDYETLASVVSDQYVWVDDEGRILTEECYQDLSAWLSEWGIIEPLPAALFGFRGSRDTP